MDLHVERYGAGKPAVFIHGASGSSLSWYFQKEYLKQFMEVVLVDLPGHGKSSGDGCERLEECRDAVYGVLKNLRLEKCYIVGHSMGGAIAMLFALTYAELLEGLVLLGTGAKLRVFPEILQGILRDKEGTVRKIAELAFSRKTPASVIESGFKEMMKCRKEVIHRDFSSCEQFSVMDRVRRITVPTLILCGGDDILTPPKYSEFLHAEIPDSALVRIPDAGHLLMIEKPEPVNRAIEAFVKKTASSER
ncbi:MAG: alpha/beta hydrolase [Syntrophorhabdales bacterium]|jgi:pimeloyl-ACP methyl ester carboxylesterase